MKRNLEVPQRLRLTDIPSASFGALQAVYSQEQLSSNVLEAVYYLPSLFGDVPIAIDAIGKLSKGQFRHLVFRKVKFGPQIEN